MILGKVKETEKQKRLKGLVTPVKKVSTGSVDMQRGLFLDFRSENMILVSLFFVLWGCRMTRRMRVKMTTVEMNSL